MSAPDLVAIGAIARPHGVLGELRVHRFNPESELLLDAEEVWLRRDGKAERRAVTRARRHKDMVLLTLDGVVGREAAEAMRGTEVCLPRDVFPAPDEDEFYHVDLIGLRATLADGTEVGEVTDVIAYPSVDCLCLAEAEGVREVPLVDPYVVEVDLEAGRIVVAHLEDLDLQRRRKR